MRPGDHSELSLGGGKKGKKGGKKGGKSPRKKSPGKKKK